MTPHVKGMVLPTIRVALSIHDEGMDVFMGNGWVGAQAEISSHTVNLALQTSDHDALLSIIGAEMVMLLHTITEVDPT